LPRYQIKPEKMSFRLSFEAIAPPSGTDVIPM
jgi:hypothetical protein